MKRIFIILLLTLPILLSAQNAKIKIDINRTISAIDPKIYGVFMEPINFSGRRMGLPDSVFFSTLYGSLYDPASPLADENVFRKDYIDAMRELKITNIRWPGGNYASGYNWQNGIGPKENRPERINLAWGGPDNNHVGTDEWGIMSRNLLTVLPIAECFNSFIRHADIVKMANFTMLTSLLGNDREKGTFLYTDQG